MCIVFFCLRGGGGEGQSRCNERSELQRADASDASDNSRMRAVVYLKLATRQTKTPYIRQTTDCTYHKLKTVHKTYNILGLGTEDRGPRGEGGGDAKLDRFLIWLSWALGPYGPGPYGPGPDGPHRALVGRALMAWACMGSPGPLWAGPLWAAPS